MGRRHGRRRHLAACDCTAKGACYTSYNAAWAAVATTPLAERAYRGGCCGHYHVTRYTQDEYAQRVAEYGVQEADSYGIVVLSTDTNEEENHEARTQAADQDRGDDPGDASGRPRAPAFQRRAPSPGEAPSPADLAQRLEARRRA